MVVDMVPGPLASTISRALDAVNKAFAAVGEALAEFRDGDTLGGLQALYYGLRNASQGLWSTDEDKDAALASLVAGLDGIIGGLSEDVLDYQRRLAESKSCWKVSLARERYLPSICSEGYEYDGERHCWPEEDVMSAQTFSAGIPNGTDSRGDGPVGGLCGAVETGDAGGISSDTRGDEQLRDLGGSLTGQVSSGLQGDGVGITPPKAETVAVTVQAEVQNIPPTMLQTDGRSGLGTDEFTQQAVETSGGFVTPQSGSRMRPPPPWWTAVEVPKWMMRLGNMLQHPVQGLTRPVFSAAVAYKSGSKSYTPDADSTILVQYSTGYKWSFWKQGHNFVLSRRLSYHEGNHDLYIMKIKGHGIQEDWMEMSAAVMSDISESSGTWWAGVIALVEDTYVRWLASSPLERLAVEPTETEQWCEGKWQRVNARASSMLLASMPTELRADMVSRRCAKDCVKMLFHLYKHFQPGGSAERQDVLKRLQAPSDFSAGDTLEDALKVLRAWPRWMDRCKAVQMTPPDPSVLARGLQNLTARHIDASPDASFRTSMLRTTLRLDARPSPEQVVAYQKHLQAELEVMQTAKSMSTTNRLDIGNTGASSAADGAESFSYFYRGVVPGEDQATALLDSGATHSLRNATSEEEWGQAEDVAVQLAGRHQLMMKITATGTLLMPFKKEGIRKDTPQAPQAQTIVPMGQLIKTLGYSMVWTPNSCELISPEGERMFLQVDSGCPQLQEMEALALIARLEDRKVEQLRNATI
ncbi:hypothetical protein AK812_SmicGene40962 [Symbiodinium microadriaticum]|uniref:Uncharacterized protein n=1 Tax=Symbiodinium microadriaticum TaxID=2951 RepID=A0A1Q9C7C7_SYMMI|nr:hypothetical protein AK812_SmicGene40962 [Symbiodinium microadriaticum]